jgi:hypothetical protein
MEFEAHRESGVGDQLLERFGQRTKTHSRRIQALREPDEFGDDVVQFGDHRRHFVGIAAVKHQPDTLEPSYRADPQSVGQRLALRAAPRALH